MSINTNVRRQLDALQSLTPNNKGVLGPLYQSLPLYSSSTAKISVIQSLPPRLRFVPNLSFPLLPDEEKLTTKINIRTGRELE